MSHQSCVDTCQSIERSRVSHLIISKIFCVPHLTIFKIFRKFIIGERIISNLQLFILNDIFLILIDYVSLNCNLSVNINKQKTSIFPIMVSENSSLELFFVQPYAKLIGLHLSISAVGGCRLYLLVSHDFFTVIPHIIFIIEI